CRRKPGHCFCRVPCSERFGLHRSAPDARRALHRNSPKESRNEAVLSRLGRSRHQNLREGAGMSWWNVVLLVFQYGPQLIGWVYSLITAIRDQNPALGAHAITDAANLAIQIAESYALK